MTRLRALALSGLVAGVAYGQQALPPDVQRFVQQRDLCDHFRGEEPYDAERRAFLEARMREFCTGSDTKLAALKRKYKRRPQVIAKLGEYEAIIESH